MLTKMFKEDETTLWKSLNNQWAIVGQRYPELRYLHDVNPNLLYDTHKLEKYNQEKMVLLWTNHNKTHSDNSNIINPNVYREKGKSTHPHPIWKPQEERSPIIPTVPTKPVRYAVSDGLVKNAVGVYEWVKINFTQTIDTNLVRVEGSPGLITSYRREAQGLLNMIYTRRIDKQTMIYLDNLAAIGKVQKDWPLHSLRPEWDLFEPLCQEVKMCSLQIQHVKGN